MSETERKSNITITGKTKKYNWCSQNVSQENEHQKKSGEMAFGGDSLLKTHLLYANKLFHDSFIQSIEEEDFAYSFTTNQLYQKEKSNPLALSPLSWNKCVPNISENLKN